MRQRRGTGVLLAIGLFKLFKAIALIAVGVEAFSLVQRGETLSALTHLVREVRLDPNNRFIHRVISSVSGLDARRLEELGIGTFVYAGVFLIEGVGLLLRKRWAEYLTIGVTASFIPLELYELVHRPSWLKALGVLANGAIALYLVFRVRRERSGRS